MSAGDLLKFILLAPIGSPIVRERARSAISVSGMSGAALWQNFGTLWLTWWLGDAVGALLVVPLLVTWIDEDRGGRGRRHWLNRS